MTGRDESIPQLHVEKVPQVAWWKQQDRSKSIKPIDKMPIAEISRMYESGFVLCDTCGKNMLISECKFTLRDHIIHMINCNSLWSCEVCYLEAKLKGEIIGECESI